MTTFDQWFCHDAEGERQSLAAEKVYDRVTELLEEELYSVANAENIIQAVYEITDEDEIALVTHIKNKDFALLGQLIYTLTFKHVESSANQVALNELDKGYL